MQQLPGSFRDRVRTYAYVFIAGLAVGIFLGWSMHGLIGFIFKLIFFGVAVAIVALAITFWKGTRNDVRRGYDPTTIDTSWRETTNRRR